MYHPEFATEIARQHRSELVRDAVAAHLRRRGRRQKRARVRTTFAWRTVQGWQFSH